MPDKSTTTFTTRLTPELHDWLRTEAFERRISINALINALLVAALAERRTGA